MFRATGNTSGKTCKSGGVKADRPLCYRQKVPLVCFSYQATDPIDYAF